MCFSLPGVKEQHYSNNKLTIENYGEKKTTNIQFYSAKQTSIWERWQSFL